jgi:hypothetical protein
MKKLFHLTCVLFVFAAIGCQKENFGTFYNSEGIQKRNSFSGSAYARNRISPEIYSAFDWDNQVAIMRGDTLIGIKVLSRTNSSGNIQYIVVLKDFLGWKDILLHEIVYEIQNTKRVAVSITSTDLISNKTAVLPLAKQRSSSGPGRSGTQLNYA